MYLHNNAHGKEERPSDGSRIELDGIEELQRVFSLEGFACFVVDLLDRSSSNHGGIVLVDLNVLVEIWRRHGELEFSYVAEQQRRRWPDALR